ncbi:MAG TPA: hypothetical protein VFD70_22980 [Anaerolineae bacterium]|nr:hypothetical protein [Anaerolineae bacterium]
MRRRSSLRINKGMGMLLLALWLILSSLTTFVPAVRSFSQFFPLLGLAAGFLILVDR